MFKPLGDRVVVKIDATEETTAGGLVLAGASREATKQATVVAIGDGPRTLTGELVAPSVAVGNRVLVENGAGIEVKDGSETLTILREAEIVAIVTK